MTEHDENGMLPDDGDVRDALQRLAPELTVPAGMVAGARRRQQRARGLVAGGAMAVVAAMVVPFALNLGGGSLVSSQDSGPESVITAAPAEESAPEADQVGGNPPAAPAAEVPAGAGAESHEEASTSGDGGADLNSSVPSPERAAAASSRLGWDVIQASPDDNRVVSPSSLAMSLAQAAEGAQGESLRSIDAALGLTGDARSESFSALREALLPYDSLPESLDADDPPETPVVHQASRILAIDAEIQQPYLERIARFYDAKAESTSLADAKSNLDAWAKLHTAGLIPKSAIEPTPDMVAVLQDALLFGAAWRQPFAHEAVIDFTTPHGMKIADGVSDTRLVPWAEGDRWQAIRLAYDDNLAADVILPADGVAPESLTVDELEAARVALDKAAPAWVTVWMPSFDLTARNDLMSALPQLDLSNLSGIISGSFAGEWKQQAKLIVTARGTVGAALTEMVVFSSAGGPDPQLEFTVDRPYAFRVLDTRTGWPLFLAAISDPTQE